MDFDSFDPFDFQDSFEGSFATGSSQHDFMFPSEIAPTSPDTSFKDVFMVCEEEELCSLQPRKQSGSFFSSFDLLPDFGLKGDFFNPKEDEGYTSPRDVHDFPFSSGSETESSAAESVSREMFNSSFPWDTREEGVWGEEDNSILTEQDQQEEEERKRNTNTNTTHSFFIFPFLFSSLFPLHSLCCQGGRGLFDGGGNGRKVG